ncbi:hypothetical protein FISHEDRAFT_67700 [Fistulina hepatica ATCC 64428]|nr:hypothetical protein FISHEDRAFT_67700 [Fistulina hepatica ATCC 64428]
MSRTSSWVVVVSLLAAFALLWSHGRFATSDYDVRDCRPLTVPLELQCAHVVANCAKSYTFLSISYIQHYFCASSGSRPFVFTSLIVWLVFLFSTLGISTSDFFTPNLATMADILRLDENVAGVTLLAFGNGSPDVFSTFSAMRADSVSLAIGELLGAATFIVSCVVGSMCIIKPFKVNAGPFLRDVSFFAIAVAFLLGILWDGRLMAWECALLVSLYTFYVCVVVFGTCWQRRRERLRSVEALIRGEYSNDSPPPFFEPYTDDGRTAPQTLAPVPYEVRPRARSHPGTVPPGLRTHDLGVQTHTSTPSPPASYPGQIPSFSLLGAIEFRHVVSSLQHEAAASSLAMFDSPLTPYAGGHYHTRSSSHSRPPRSYSPETHPWDSTLGLPLDDCPLRPAENDEEHAGEILATSIPSISWVPPTPTESDTECQIPVPMTKRQRLWHIVERVFHVLFPSLHHFKEKTVIGQIASVFAAPAITLLTLTLPVAVTDYDEVRYAMEKIDNARPLIDFEEEGVERVLVAEDEVTENSAAVSFNKWLLAVQCVLGPLFCVVVLLSGNENQSWILVSVAIISITVGMLVAVFGDRSEHTPFRALRCSMGFCVAVVWIMAIADEVVNVLQAFGSMFGLSEAIIGLTIFAFGNSLADLVANMSVAVFAPIMGFSACFGGPMLNILLGIGISGLYVMSNSAETYEPTFSPTLLVSATGLLVLLALMLVCIPLNGYMLTRSWGFFLISCYTVLMVVNVVVESRS